MLTMLATGVMLVPTMGLWPLVGIAAVCGTTLYVAEQFNKRR